MLQKHNGVCFKKMEIADRINRINRIRSNPVYTVNPVKDLIETKKNTYIDIEMRL